MQSKGLEWDMVFIVKVNGYTSRITICWNDHGLYLCFPMIQANESEIPLLHEFNGVVKENGTSVEVSLFRELFIYLCLSRIITYHAQSHFSLKTL